MSKHPMNAQMTEQNQAAWLDAKIFHDEATGIAIRVQKKDGQHRTSFSYDIGRMWEGRFTLHSRPHYKTENGIVSIKPYDIQALGKLMAQFEWWMQEELQKQEDQFLEHKRAKETQSLSRGKPDRSKRSGTHWREGQ